MNHESYVDVIKSMAIQKLYLAPVLLFCGRAEQYDAASALPCFKCGFGPKKRPDASFTDQIVTAGVTYSRKGATPSGAVLYVLAG
jgi:hypothetical protein